MEHKQALCPVIEVNIYPPDTESLVINVQLTGNEIISQWQIPRQRVALMPQMAADNLTQLPWPGIAFAGYSIVVE